MVLILKNCCSCYHVVLDFRNTTVLMKNVGCRCALPGSKFWLPPLINCVSSCLNLFLHLYMQSTAATSQVFEDKISYFCFVFFKYILLFILLQLSQFFSLCPPLLSTLPPSDSPHTVVHSHGSCISMFFGYSIPYAVLYILMTIL